MKTIKLIVMLFLIQLLSPDIYAQKWEQLEIEYNIYRKNNENRSAVDKSKEMLGLIKNTEGDTSLKLVISNKLIGNAYNNINVDSALYYYDQGLELLKFQNRSRHIQAAKILYNEANVFYAKHNYRKYAELLNNVAEINRELDYPEFPFVEWPLNKLYFYYEAVKNRTEHERLLKERIRIFKKFNQTNNVDYASVCQSLGSYYITQENFEDAKYYIEESTQAFIRSIGENSYECASNYYWLGSIAWGKNDHINSETYFNKSINILKDTLSKSDNKSQDNIVRVFYLACQDAVARFYYELKNYEKAQDLWGEQREYYIEVNDTVSSNEASVSLALAYIDDRQYTKALSLLLEQKGYNPDNDKRINKGYLEILQSLALVSSALDSILIADNAIKEELSLSKKHYGTESKEYFEAIKEKCNFLLRTYSTGFSTTVKPNDEILRYLSLFDNLSKKLYGSNSRKYIEAVEDLAQFYNKIGDISKAEKYYREYNILLKEVNVPINNSYFLNRLFYARFLLKIKKYDSAYTIISNLFLERLAFIQQNLFYLKDYDRQLFWAEEKKYFDEYFSIASMVHNTVAQSPELAYNTALLTKGLLLESTGNIQSTVLNSNDTQAIELLRRLKIINSELANMFSSRYKGRTQQQRFYTSEDSIIMNDLYFQSDSIEQLLSRNMASFAQYRKDSNKTWQTVKTKLNASEAAIEFAQYYNEKDSSQYYIAIVVLPNSIHPELVKLCTEKELEKLSPVNDLEKLYLKIWKPLESLLGTAKTIYYSPTGILNNISFCGLFRQKNGAKEYLIDRYVLNQVTTTKSIENGLQKTELKNWGHSITLLGGINYDELPDSVSNFRNNSNQENHDFFQYVVAKTEDSKTRYGFSYLPATNKEIKNIADIMASTGWRVSIFNDKTASEGLLKSLNGSSDMNILHIATHGFAFPDPMKSNHPLSSPSTEDFKDADMPMVRSGLLFAGANLTWRGKQKIMLDKTGEDGVLTAFELSMLLLDKTKLVVLSACETGLGDINGSEGTFGLRRAIKLAGVENMIISLWQIDDETTMELMTSFYSELSKNNDIASSFSSAQKAMRNKYPNQPKNWAGLILVR